MKKPATLQGSDGAIRPLLRRLGLDDREIDIYLCLLSLKSAKATAIAKESGQSRSHTYLLLRSLAQKGLVSEVEHGKVLHFVAESPTCLLNVAEDRASEMQEVRTLLAGAMPLLQSLSPALVGQPRVTLLHGVDGMRQVYRDVFNFEFCSFFNAEAMFNAFGKNVAITLATGGRRLIGRDLLVDNKGGQRYVDEVEQNADYSIRFLPKHCRFSTDTLVYGDTIALFSYDQENTIVRIENKNIADSLRAWFNVIWEIGRPTRRQS
jgi:sugar-specific transcriptional regulator TrmB